MENVLPKKKPSLVILQSYYDRDVPTSHNTDDVDARRTTLKKEQPTSLVKEQPVREKVEIAAPTPPPMPPPDDTLANRIAVFSFDKSNPPPCPTPDYDSSSISSGSSLVVKTTPYINRQTNMTKPFHINHTQQSDNTHAKSQPSSSQIAKSKKLALEDRVEMISIESFTLNNPSSPKPKPPQTYFGTMNGAKKPKSVAVTIGEYPSSIDRKQPTRFHFLPASSLEEKNTATQNGDKQIGHLLQSELAQTLSRSNLKNQTDIQGNNIHGISKKIVPSNGTTIISVNSDTKPSESSHPRSVSNSIESRDTEIGKPLLVRVGNGVDNTQKDLEVAGQLNGILKNANVPTVVNGKCKNGIHQKSISFGEITTVISDGQL